MKTIQKNKRSFLSTIATGTFMLIAATGIAQKNQTATKTSDASIRPYHISISQDALTDLRNRVNATRWPDKETVTDQSQGVKLQQIQSLVKYWGTDYDWRKTETKLNQLPQFVTNIDGLDIQFIHIKSKNKNALPLIITHGWPGSFFELIKVIGPLTDPVAYGGKAEDAFDLVIPSMPGYGFSEKPTGTGWGPEKIGNAWDVLMKRLGYKNYVSQGGDWGSVIADAMARQAPQGLLGIHVNMPATVPADVAKALKDGDPAPQGLSVKEKAAFISLNKLYTKGGGYAGMMVTRPQTLGYGLTDSPVGLASFFLDKFNEWTYSGGNAEKSLTKDEMLDDISLYWLTNTANSSAQLYWENNTNNFNVVEQKTHDIKIPVAVTVFPGEIYQAPKSWAEKAYKNLIYFNEVNKGGHFASWEEPQLFTIELRAAFKSLRK
ncbi:epoxide hydrolase family protein [Flavobacterium pectinovorum]|uniref:Multidrug MFS transporter n=1 Tax=Flavobacterium pectinovorum TaxID=29533 RepID=A0AB36NZX8_9FLAO|nr:epoxide hydrolase [Flavobacterium pectinovorum]OXB04410.1 multidrug MFS transporter [Flavobacterium pectinovorum]SHL57355.1 Pimeloyl-ACP methyl ester carboxylesterase [Flavobacterium pectinovorum]